MDPLTYNEVRTRPSLEERLESIISGAALMADSSCTRDDRRERIVQECNSVRQALQDLLSEYMSNVSNTFFENYSSIYTEFCFNMLHNSSARNALLWVFIKQLQLKFPYGYWEIKTLS